MKLGLIALATLGLAAVWATCHPDGTGCTCVEKGYCAESPWNAFSCASNCPDGSCPGTVVGEGAAAYYACTCAQRNLCDAPYNSDNIGTPHGCLGRCPNGGCSHEAFDADATGRWLYYGNDMSLPFTQIYAGYQYRCPNSCPMPVQPEMTCETPSSLWKTSGGFLSPCTTPCPNTGTCPQTPTLVQMSGGGYTD